jgi:hypothetical protein
MAAVDAVAFGGLIAPLTAIGISHAQIANVFTDDAARRAGLVFFVDVAFPEIRRLHDVHVAVENVIALFRHRSILPMLAIIYSALMLSIRWAQRV